MENLFEYLISKKNKNKVTFNKAIPFKNVKVGMHGVDYNGNKGIIRGIGKLLDISWMDETGFLSSYIENGSNDPGVIVDLDNGETNIGYLYGPEGFACYK